METKFNLKVVFGYRCRKTKDYFENMEPFFEKESVSLICQSTFCVPKFVKVSIKSLLKIVRYRLAEKNAKSFILKNRSFFLKNKFYEFIWLLEAFLRYVQFCGCLHREKPDVLVIWNGHRWIQAVMVLAAKNLKVTVAYAETGYFKSTFTLDPDGVNAASLLPKKKEFFLRKDEFDKHEKRTMSQSKEYILVPLQIDSDSQILLHSPWIKNMDELIAISNRLSKNLPRKIQLIIKVHPKMGHSLIKKLLKTKMAENVQIICDGNINELIQNALAVLTINSTVGIEALAESVPVILLGEANYDVDGVVLKATNYEELDNSIQLVSRGWKPNENLSNALLDYQKNKYHIYGNHNNIDEKHVAEFKKRIEEIFEGNVDWKL